MRASTPALVLCAAATLGVIVQCGGSAPSGPSVTPTPIPAPTPAPTATPDPNVPPVGSGCGQPYPPPVTRFQAKIHQKDVDFWQLDSTPLVGPNVGYCWEVGFTDGRSICPVRPEGAEDREACENWRVGIARDTGRPGPTWTKADGSFCTGPASGCENHPSTQYSLFTYLPGTYIVTAENGADCTVSH
jgi:hypothetical protein